ncbi:MAG: amidohydrolase family protein [Bacteroidales bacterium]|nr:amidohydrolase family protein [Bacteroidales bacterium]
MMIDTHHHLWNYNLEEYRWMDDSMSVLKRDYLPDELEQELQKAGITGTVVIQARQSLEETRWLLKLADEHWFIEGVVGWLDLRSKGLERELEVFATHSKLVGVRHVIHDEPDDDFMLCPDFIKGIAQLERFDLVYDLLLFPRHLGRAAELVKAFPRQRFVLDHMGKPQIKTGKIEPWKTELEKLAVHSNVWCKLSGMVTEADHKLWQYKELLPYIETVLNTFGPERIMLGSDWPVCRLAGAYSEVLGIVLKFIESMDETDRTKILYQNAIDCYQLKN